MRELMLVDRRKVFHNTKPTEQPPMQLSGRRLTLARSVWMVIVALNLALLLVAIPAELQVQAASAQ